MTPTERTESLQKFGYDRGEAAFLSLAALHGGYFVRRQYLQFIGGSKGWKDVALIKKLADAGHCGVAAYRHDRLVYHLSSKPLYDAMGESGNRNRREHQPSTVKNKIMGLDFVLAHQGFEYLSTTEERSDYFVRVRNFAREDLPARSFSSPRGHPSNVKYFAESYPIFLHTRVEPGGSVAPQPHFCYIDEGLQSTDRFATYLRQYGQLLAELRHFHVIYVADSPRLFASAERVFEKFAAVFLQPNRSTDSGSERLLAYFQRRRRYENQDFSDFDTAALIQFREEKKHFAGESYEALYTRWRIDETAGRRPLIGADIPGHDALGSHFSTFLLEQDYELFGTLTRHAVKRRNAISQTERPAEWFGAGFGQMASKTVDKEEEIHGQELGERR